MTASEIIPARLLPLLQEPNIGFLGTVRPDGSPQVNPMWFEFDGEYVLFTHTTARQKFRNLQANPAMSLAVTRAEDPYRYLELRGRLIEVRPDTTGAFYVRLGRRYGDEDTAVPDDHDRRVVLVMSVEHAGSN